MEKGGVDERGFGGCVNADMPGSCAKWQDSDSMQLFDSVLHFIGYPDAGRGDLTGLPVSFQNVKKP